MITRRQKNGRFQSMSAIAIASSLVVGGFCWAEADQRAGTTATAIATVEANGIHRNAHAEKLKELPFSLTVAESNGELIYTFAKNGDLETIVGTNEVRFETSGTVISADDSEFLAAINELTSTGSVSAEIAHFPGSPFVNQEHCKVVVTADSLTYKLAEKEMAFQGNVIIRQCDSSGDVKEISGDRMILVICDNGKLQLQIRTGSRGEPDRRSE